MKGIKEYLEQMGFTDMSANISVQSAATMAEDYGDWLKKEWLKSAEAVKNPKDFLESKNIYSFDTESRKLQVTELLKEYAALCVAMALIEPESEIRDRGHQIKKLQELLEMSKKQLAAQEAECQQLREAQQWHSIKDCSPPEAGLYLVVVEPLNDHYIAYYKRNQNLFQIWGASRSVDDMKVTHWMTLPESPSQNDI